MGVDYTSYNTTLTTIAAELERLSGDYALITTTLAGITGSSDQAAQAVVDDVGGQLAVVNAQLTTLAIQLEAAAPVGPGVGAGQAAIAATTGVNAPPTTPAPTTTPAPGFTGAAAHTTPAKK